MGGGHVSLRFYHLSLTSVLWKAHFSPRMQDVTMTLTHVDFDPGTMIGLTLFTYDQLTLIAFIGISIHGSFCGGVQIRVLFILGDSRV
jgi:hypothetical protein